MFQKEIEELLGWRKHSLYIAKTIPKASFVLVKEQGHELARKDPERFNREVLQFLSET